MANKGKSETGIVILLRRTKVRGVVTPQHHATSFPVGLLFKFLRMDAFSTYTDMQKLTKNTKRVYVKL